MATRSRDIVVPNDLEDANRISKGASEYAEMCSGCHLAPGMERTEISRGLHPRAPELRRKTDLTPAEQFWIVKHGVKMTGMPAWGVTHNDELLWDVVAFVRKLPELTPEQYETLVKDAPETRRADEGNGDGRPPTKRGAPAPVICPQPCIKRRSCAWAPYAVTKREVTGLQVTCPLLYGPHPCASCM